MTEAVTPSPAAVRARKHRERRRSGARCVTVQLWQWGVDQLVALGYLRSTERNDLEAIKVAASEFFSAALSSWTREIPLRPILEGGDICHVVACAGAASCGKANCVLIFLHVQSEQRHLY
jgi:hypothetical protein